MSDYWQEDNNEEYVLSDKVVDISFKLKGKRLAVDHAWQLKNAIHDLLPWFADEPLAAIHLIHVAESANGWIRPEGKDAFLHMSRRTQMTLRIPSARYDDVAMISGQSLDLGYEPIEILAGSRKLLKKSNIIFARYLDMGENEDEARFLENIHIALREKGISARKMLCGKTHSLMTPDGSLLTRSLMIADLEVQASVKLQQEGIGSNRNLGCGVFIAHKGIEAVGGAQKV